MEVVMEFLLMILGLLLGGIMFCDFIPRHFKQTDLKVVSDDLNPGTFNAFKHCGIKIGIICLTLDFLKGFVPVFLASLFLKPDNIYFSLIMMAPVLGHAIGIFNRGNGGKCIATTFGVLFGILPLSLVVFLLADFYIVLAIIFRHNLFRCSILTFVSFAFLSSILMYNDSPFLVYGILLITMIVIFRHYYMAYVKKNMKVCDGEANG